MFFNFRWMHARAGPVSRDALDENEKIDPLRSEKKNNSE